MPRSVLASIGVRTPSVRSTSLGSQASGCMGGLTMTCPWRLLRQFHWYNVDLVADYLVELGVRPIMELDYMPRSLTASCKDPIFDVLCSRPIAAYSIQSRWLRTSSSLLTIIHIGTRSFLPLPRI